MLSTLFKNVNSGLDGILKRTEAGEGTIRDNMDDLSDILEDDEHYREVITELLKETDAEGNALIDLVLVSLDCLSRDLEISCKILNDVIIPELNGENERILVAPNQADIAMKTGRHWDYEKNEPDETLINFLNEKVDSIKERNNTNSDNYEHNDDENDYNESVKDSFYESFDYISDGVDTGAEIGGTILGIPGAIVGAFLGGFVGCVKSIIDDIF